MTTEASHNPRPWATVTDSQATTWTLRINLRQAMELRNRRKVDLLATEAAKTAAQLSQDPIGLAEVAFDICAAQRGQLAITEESDFLARFDGDSWSELLEATTEAIIDFFPPSRREALTTIWRRQKNAEHRIFERMNQKLADGKALQALDTEADQALELFERKLGEIGQIRS